MDVPWQQLQQVLDIPDPYGTLGVPRTAEIEEIRRSYKQKLLETHPDKLPPTASEEERKAAEDLFHQVLEAFEVIGNPGKRRAYDVHNRPLPLQTPARASSIVSTLSQQSPTRPSSIVSTLPQRSPTRASSVVSTLSQQSPTRPSSIVSTLPQRSPARASSIVSTIPQRSPTRASSAISTPPQQTPARASSIVSTLSQQTPTRASSIASTLSRTTSFASLVPTLTPAATPARPSTSSRSSKSTSSLPERPLSSGTVVVVELVDEAQQRRMKDRSEWAKKSEERRLDKLKAYTTAEEIQNLGQKQAALVEKMIQDLFALTPEWEARRRKARAYKASRASARVR